MGEQQLRFRVGVLTIVATGIAVYLTFQFGEIGELWRPTYPVNVFLKTAPGVYEGTPVKIHGVKIGKVRTVALDGQGVRVILDIEQKYPISQDARICLSRGLLGDTTLDVHPGNSSNLVELDQVIQADTYVDPMQSVQKLETSVASALSTIESTSQEWREVGHNVNGLIGSHQGELEQIVVQTANSLGEFSRAMQAFTTSAEQANRILGDPQNQENLQKTLAVLPAMVEDTRLAITAVRGAVQKADKNLEHLAASTEPLAEHSKSITLRLDSTLAHVERLSQELSELAQLANNKNGTIRSLAEDASLYRNLDRSSESLSILLANLTPVLKDLRIFSDKIARHPELMGVGGAISGSDGTKTVSPVGFETPARGAGEFRSVP